MRVSGENDGVADLVTVQVVENSVAVGAIAVPGILMMDTTEQEVVTSKLCGLRRPLQASPLVSGTLYCHFGKRLTGPAFVEHRENNLLSVGV